MENRPAVAFTIARGKHALFAARLLRATFEAAHPDIPFFLVEDTAYAFFARQKAVGQVAEIVSLRTMVGWFLSLHFPRVVYLDADVLVLDRLEGLLDWPAGAQAAVTRDVEGYHCGIPDAPRINAGVLAATSPKFWQTWMLTIYSHLVPVGPNFFDQFALRLLAQTGAIPFHFVPERETRDFYNIAYRDHPGDWALAEGPDGVHVRKGDARVRLWHWAGNTSKLGLRDLPEPVGRAVQARLEQAKGKTSYEEENRLLHLMIEASGPRFLQIVADEFATMQSLPVDGFSFGERVPPPGLYASDAPAAWEALRPPVPGLHRRLLRNVPRYVYARDPERLFHADVDALDVPLPVG